MAPRLKVFVTSDGLTDYVVATTSKPKALAAWGSHQDLFKTGLARETDDPELAKVAKARPDEVLRRAAGTRGELASRKAKPKAKAPPKAKLRKPAGPTVAQRRKQVTDLEARLKAEDDAYWKAVDALETRRRTLDAGHEAARGRLRDQLDRARQALGPR